MTRQRTTQRVGPLFAAAAALVVLVGSVGLYVVGTQAGTDRSRTAPSSASEREPGVNSSAPTREAPSAPSAPEAPAKSEPQARKVVAGKILAPSPRTPALSRGASDAPSTQAEADADDDSTSEDDADEPATQEPEPTPVSEPLAALDLINRLRADAGCAALAWNDTLGAVAAAHSTDMATQDYFDHTGLDGRSAADRMTDAGYEFSVMAENIAAGYDSAQAAVDGWMASPGHRDNLLNCALTETGLGLAHDADSSFGHYWTQVFGTPPS